MRQERTIGGLPLLRLEDAFLLRGRGGAWTIDFVAIVGGVSHQFTVHIGRRRELDRLLERLPAPGDSA